MKTFNIGEEIWYYKLLKNFTNIPPDISALKHAIIVDCYENDIYHNNIETKYVLDNKDEISNIEYHVYGDETEAILNYNDSISNIIQSCDDNIQHIFNHIKTLQAKRINVKAL